MKLHGSTENKISEDEIDENVPQFRSYWSSNSSL